jgi:predicted nucleic acid-binding protein
MRNTVFLDANIVLEVLLKSRPKTEKARQLLLNAEQTSISMLSVHLIFYFGAKAKIDKRMLENTIDTQNILDLTESDYNWAKRHCADGDLEDALQVAIAVRSRCKSFVTLDKSLAKNYQKHINTILL